MKNSFEAVRFAYSAIEKRIPFRPKLALVLGSGLGGLAEEMTDTVSIGYAEIEGFPISTVAGHNGRFLFGRLGGVPIVCMQGRVHYYEGYGMDEVTLPIRLMAKMGVKTLFLTNAAGGIADRLSVGSLMLITDHISCFVPSPLRGANDDRFGPRFPDMSEVYSQKLQKNVKESAARLHIPLESGVYLQASGPQYETPAEIRMYRTLGADAVGMSTACEAIAARHAGLSVLAISLITNKAAGLSQTKLSHEEVTAASKEAAPRFRALVKETVREIAISD
ncbi:MAG: purine-nucleoside phosphorylase [Clostridia bacterium]|nr:purine-nucleoside phosphorylase [Clostridia bacterium]